MLSHRGFTLLETLIAMVVFLIVLAIAAQAFNLIIVQAAKYSKMEETNIEGVIGLEMLRHDLAQMGYGLPWGFSKLGTGDLVSSTISYNESADSIGSNFNDASGGVPRAIVGIGGGASITSSSILGDYIGIKATSVGTSSASRRWTYIPFHNASTSSGRVSQPVTIGTPPKNSEIVIAINSNFNIPDKDHQLLVDPSTNSSFSTGFGLSGMSNNYLPATDQDTVMLYGINGTNAPRMPFNRVDYFVSKTAGTVPPFCAPNTGVLYKATVKHSDGTNDLVPVLDCVADMRVVIGWGTDSSGGISNYSTLPTTIGGTPSDVVGSISSSTLGSYLTSDANIRKGIKVIKIYILAQEGKVDNNYTGPASIVVGADPTAGDNSNAGLPTTHNTYTFSSSQKNYRWKVYRIVVQPKNLASNQS